MRCVGGRGAARAVEVLCVAVEELCVGRGAARWSMRCVGVSDASREVPVLLRLLGVVSLRSFCLSAREDLSEFIREVFCILNILIVEEKEF